MNPTIPPCLADEPLPAAVREADAMLGMWAEMFRNSRTRWGVGQAIEDVGYVKHMSADEVRDLLYAALIRLTDPLR
jgi:hypothetical protein